LKKLELKKKTRSLNFSKIKTSSSFSHIWHKAKRHWGATIMHNNKGLKSDDDNKVLENHT
jgi:hypothetical protein